jgi:predicted HNH restriction endonuclease
MSESQHKDRSIWIYGNPDKSHLGFPMPGDLTQYIKADVFAKEKGRYRYTQGKNADVIVLSRDGLAYGHLDVEGKVKPNDMDRKAYPRVKYVYLVRKATLYATPVPLSDLSLTKKMRFGRKITEAEFAEIQKLAGGKEVSYNDAPLFAEELPASETYLEGAARIVSVNAYERNREARSKCLEHHGWACAVCAFNMAELYGHLGDGVIHVHHLRELASLGGEYKVDINDLRPVCPNCHAILHTASPAMTIEKLINIIAARNAVQWPKKV